jgi:hypothetical protein
MSRKEKKDWSPDTLLSIVGFVFELVRIIVKALQKRGGTINHLRRLLKEQELVDRVFDLIVEPEASKKQVLSDEERIIHVTDRIMREKFAVEIKFRPVGLGCFHGNFEKMKPLSLVEILETTGERSVILMSLMTSEDIETCIARMDKRGYRPASIVEAFALINAELWLQRRFFIVVLDPIGVRDGSFRVVQDASNVSLCGNGSSGFVTITDFRFPFVRMDTPKA